MSILNVLLNLNKIFPEKANFKDVEIVLGKSGHTSSTELFYRNLIYRDFPLGSGEVYVINEKGVVMNLLMMRKEMNGHAILLFVILMFTQHLDD